MKHADALTIIVPLYGRVAMTRQFMNYLQYVKCPFRVLFADGSKDAERRNTRDWLATGHFPDVNFEYFEFPFDKDAATFMKKISEIFTKVTTPLTVMMDNDDLFCLNGLYEGIEFLSENDEYCGYRQDVRHMSLSDFKIQDDSCYKAPSLDEDTALERVSTVVVKRNAIWHEVLRASIYYEFHDILSSIDIGNDLQLWHSLAIYYPPVFGKILRKADRPYYFHGLGVGSVCGSPHFAKQHEWIKFPLFDRSASQAVSVIGNALAFHASMPLEEAKLAFANVFFRNLLQVSNKRGNSNFHVKNMSAVLIERHVRNSDVYDKTVQERLSFHHSVRDNELLELNEQLSTDVTYAQVQDKINGFRKGGNI